MSQIQFDTIPNSILKPGDYFEFNTRLAVNTLPGNPQRMALLAPMIETTQNEGLANKAIPVYSTDDAARYYGAGSLASSMVAAAIRANPYLQLDVVALSPDSEGVAATGSVSITGTATSAGTLRVSVCAEQVAVSIAKGDTATVILKALEAAMAQVPSLLVTAKYAAATESSSEKVTLTATTTGEWGNSIGVEVITSATGLNLVLNTMYGGELDPDITYGLDAIFSAGHNIIAIPFTSADALAALSEHLTKTGSAMEQRGAVGCAGWTAQMGAGITLSSGVDDGRISMPWYRASMKTPGQLAAAYAAVMASQEDPARPLNTLPLTGMDIVAPEFYESRTEQEKALHNGLTPIEVGPGNTVQIVRAISTYTVNAQGVSDPALLDITSIRTLDYTRKACRERISQRFPREKLSTRTPPKVKSELYDVLLKLEDAEILENVAANKDKLIVQKSGTDPNRLDSVIPADVVNGLHVFAGRIDMIL